MFDFIEADVGRAQHLDSLVSAQKSSLPSSCKTQVINAKFDEALTSVLDMLDGQKKKLAPAFVMIDPFGVSDTPMDVIRRILKNDRSEVYVSFMYEALNRFKATDEFAPHLDGLFGTDEWRDGIEIEDGDERKRFYFDLYKEQLRAAGAEYVVHFELYGGNRLVYAIFFGTHHWLGADVMKQAIWKVAPFGDFAFHGSHSSQLLLGVASPDFGPLQASLQKAFEGKGWVGIKQIEEFVASDKTDYHTGQLRQGALIPLESSGKIEIKEGTRKKRNTYPDGTKLRFV